MQPRAIHTGLMSSAIDLLRWPCLYGWRAMTCNATVTPFHKAQIIPPEERWSLQVQKATKNYFHGLVHMGNHVTVSKRTHWYQWRFLEQGEGEVTGALTFRSYKYPSYFKETLLQFYILGTPLASPSPDPVCNVKPFLKVVIKVIFKKPYVVV